MAIAAPAGGAHRQEHGGCARHTARQIGVKTQPARPHPGSHHFIQAGLEDGNAAGLQGFDLGRVLVYADHFMAELRQAGAGHKPDIAGSDHGDAHGESISKAGLFWPERRFSSSARRPAVAPDTKRSQPATP